MKQNFHAITQELGLALALAVANLAAGFPAHAGNAETHQQSARPALLALGRDNPDARGDGGAATQAPRQPLSEPGGVLTLRQALELALRGSPELAAASHGVGSAEAHARQAGAFPNPELEIEAEEFGGSGDRRGFGGAATTVRLSQSVELGGKRGKRQRVAQSEARLAGWDYEAKRLDLVARTRKAFVDVLLAQGQLALAESLLTGAEDVRKAAAERVKSGKVAPLEETRAGVEVANTRIARDRARRELETSRQRLAASWGGTAQDFKEAGGVLDAVEDVPPLENLSSLLADIPEIARWSEEVTQARDALVLAEAARIPDVGISVGISRFEEDGTHAGTVGLSLPLPLFDRNAGGITAAKHQSARAEYEQRAARLRATTDLVEAYSRLETARAEAMTIKAELLPGAQQAFDAARTGYREGKYGHLEVLDTQRTLNEARTRYLDTLAAYHKAAADVERLTGTPLNTIR